MRRRGFTLIEVVIVVGISVLLTSVVLTYSSSGRDQVYLGIQKAQVAQIISKAKSLTVSTYNQPNVPCGYGVYFNYSDPANPRYEIFRYKVSPCPSVSDLKNAGIVHGPGYSPQSKYVLPPNLRFGTGLHRMDTVFFMPPDPQTLIWENGASEDQGIIYLETKSGSASAKVSVNSGGQVTF
jgi:prepilin-type N-terminal cleavage/methylation domain-containing protein